MSANKRPQSPDTTKPSLSHQSSPSDVMEPDKGASASKVVFAEPESVSPPAKDKRKETDSSNIFDAEKTSKQFRASLGKKRLSGRPSMERLESAARSLASNPSITSLLTQESEKSNASPKHRHTYERLSKQVSSWLQQEKARRVARRAKRTAAQEASRGSVAPGRDQVPASHTTEPDAAQERRGSDTSEGSVALEHLANILERTLSLKSNEGSPRKRRPSHGHKLSSIMKRHSAVSSDTDYFDGAQDLVPGCEAVLDNSKTMAYSGGGAESGEEDAGSTKPSRSARKEKEAWSTFKYEILRITHTLKLKGWRRVPLDQSDEIEVERLSGALTNAVYVVSPPKELRVESGSTTSLPKPKNPPPKLLLRIYGPQVEHLIDREAELQILRRLARKRIGPRLLGTFTNGRFEEFFNAQTLTFDDLRVPETSKQIAKRMRELHEGIELLRKEREGGPFVWCNWDKWVDRCEQVVTWLDQQILEDQKSNAPSASKGWKQRGLVCGVEWKIFRQTIEKYRKWLEEQYGGLKNVNERLVFAHNDAQYGNILRLMPAGESPLLLPANEHKQLVVIDFEYANANLPGLEFANHFTEWCYNYHGEIPHLCNTKYYPTPEEQCRFIQAYLLHNPTFKASASNPPTPHLGPIPSSGSTTALAATAAPTSISAFMLDSRAPPGEKYSYHEQEAQSEQRIKQETQRLMAETRLWRLANSAQWTAWGIVQANISGLPDFDKEDGKAEGEDQQGESADNGDLEMKIKPAEDTKNGEGNGHANGGGDAQNGEAGNGDTGNGEADQPPPEDEEFDYLAYAQERAMFVWGDAIQLGIIEAEELPEELRKRVKRVEY